MNKPTLEQKISKCDPEIKNFIAALKYENLKLQKDIAKLQAQLVTIDKRNKILKDYEDRHLELTSMSKEELIERLKEIVKKATK